MCAHDYYLVETKLIVIGLAGRSVSDRYVLYNYSTYFSKWSSETNKLLNIY